MGQIEDLRLFVQIVNDGSLSSAARNLIIAKSAISRRLAQLERRYGTVLIDRSPGKWAVTGAGRELYQRAHRIVADAEEIDADFSSLSANLSGPLSVSVPREFGLTYLNSQLTAFQASYPQISLTVDFDDRVVDLQRENYDFVLRITAPGNVSAHADRIGTVQHLLCASPDYLNRHPAPRTVDDLHDHRLLHYGTARRAVWRFFSASGSLQEVTFQPHLNTNSGMYLQAAAEQGLGITRLPGFLVDPAVASGTLVRVLPDVSEPPWGIYLIHDENRRMTRRMRLFAQELKRACLDPEEFPSVGP